MTPEIKVTSGELREGNSIILSVDFTGDKLNSFYTNKRFTAFAERNSKWDTFTQEYYYNIDEGEIYEAQNSNDLSVRELIIGRLFCRFLYTNMQGVEFELKKIFQVLPNHEIIVSDNIIEGKQNTFSNIHDLKGVTTTFTFSDDSSTASTTGSDIQKTIIENGYYILNTNINWTNASYKNDEIIVWNSSPEDLLTTTTNGYFGGGTIANTSLIETISSNYLVKQDITKYITPEISFSKSIDNTIDAPLRGYISDTSDYTYTLEGDNRIEFLEVDYGDNYKEKLFELNFFKDKTYKKSGNYVITFTINTIHDLPEVTYRQHITIVEEVEVEPFFSLFFKKLFDPSLFNSDGFNDISKAWGYQMDRLYNETQNLMISLDVDTIDNKFLSSFASNYGDFEEIYEKIGYSSFSKDFDDDNKFDLLNSYNFFDRVNSGDITPTEKEEFVWYIKNTKNKLMSKGTPASLEDIISQFSLIATVKELWTQFKNQEQNKYLVDEVFNGNYSENNTGITSHNISMPNSDNETYFINDSRSNSYIEINTRDNIYNTYYTDTSDIVTSNGKKYLKINTSA